MMNFVTRSSLRVVLIYLVFGILWIAVSDRVLELFVTDPHRLTLLQTGKGWVFVAAGALILYLGIRHEFSKRSRIERALIHSEQKYRVLMQSAHDAILLFDADSGLILEVNERFEKLTNMRAVDLTGRHYSSLHPVIDHDQCRALFDLSGNNETSLSNYPCTARPDGRVIPLEVSANIVTLGNKRIFQGIFHDVSERREAEARITCEINRAEQYLDVAAVIIMVINADETVRLVNKKGCEIFGYPAEEIIGKNFFDSFIPERLRAEARSIFARILAGKELNGALAYFEFPVLTKSGEERILSWYNTLMRDSDGRVIATLSSGEDVTGRKKAEGQAQYRLDHLSALHAIDLIINASLDIRVTLQEFLAFVTSQLRVDAASVLLLNPHTQELEYAAMRGFRNRNIRHSRLRLGEGIAGRAALERRTIGVPDLNLQREEFKRTPLIAGEDFLVYYAVPLLAKGQVKGVLDVLHRSPLAVDEEWLSFLESLAAQAAIAIDNAQLFGDLQRSNAELILAYDTTIEGWARALELRDQETEGHTKRTVEMTLRLGRSMGMSEAELAHVRRGALLHDIGKMSVPDSILLKTGPLTEEEWQIMRRHPVYAYEMLSPISYLRPALDIPYCHHERWDGTGYPRGLKGEQIPLAARIFSIADIWDALVSERRYHTAWPEERIREYFRSLSGTQFDPRVVELFLNSDHIPKEEVAV